MTLKPHPWDKYGKPTERDVDTAGQSFICVHGYRKYGEPRHSTKDQELEALYEDLEEYSTERDNMERALEDAENAISEVQRIINSIEWHKQDRKDRVIDVMKWENDSA